MAYSPFFKVTSHQSRIALLLTALFLPVVSRAQAQAPAESPTEGDSGEPGSHEPAGTDEPDEPQSLSADSAVDVPADAQLPDQDLLQDSGETREHLPVTSESDLEPRPSASAPIRPAEAPAQPAARDNDRAEDEPPRVEIHAAPGRGLTIKSSENFSLNLRSRIQLRYQLNVPPEDDAGEREIEQLVNIGTARLWFSGNLFRPELTYMIQLAVADRDFRDGAKSPLYDAYLDFKAHRDLSLRAGQFFVPFDRLRTVREWALQMADRPRPVLELTLDRDVGVLLYSERFLSDESPLAWQLGAFGGGGTNLSKGREPGGLFVGRVELRPLGPLDDDREGDLERRSKPALALGVGVAKNFNTDRLRSTTGARFLGGTTDYMHAAADAVFKWQGFAIQGEYLWKDASADEIASLGEDGLLLIESTRSGYGWIAQASYVFDPPIEIVARLSRLYARSGTDPLLRAEAASRGQEVGAGLNYYFNGHWMKIQADWIALVSPAFELEQADHVAHLQLDVTF